MSLPIDNKAPTLLNQLRSGQEVEKTLRSILNLIAQSSVMRQDFIRSNIFGVFSFVDIAADMKIHSGLATLIKLTLCQEKSFVKYIAFEIDLVREAIEYLFSYVHTMSNEKGIYPSLSNINSAFPKHTGKIFENIGFYLMILTELGKHSDDVVSEVSKYNIIPRLLFIIEKCPRDIKVLEQTIVKCSQKLLNLTLAYIDVSTSVCVKLDLFKWVLRIAKQDLYKAKEVEMMETLSLLSFSDEFLTKTDEILIVSQWVYHTLCMILVPEMRSEDFLQVNQGVKENEFMVLVSYLSQILGNVSRSQGGMEEIISSMGAYEVDVVWRVQHLLIQFNITKFDIWYTIMYLMNNMLRYPYYSPPLYASEIAVLTFGVIANISDHLLTVACRAFRYLEFTESHKSLLCEISISRISNRTHSVTLPSLQSISTLKDTTSIIRNIPKITKEWNLYFENKKKPWETITSALPTPSNIHTHQDRIIFKFSQQFHQYKLFFKKLPNPCEFCQDFFGPPFLSEDQFWKIYSPENNENVEGVEAYLPIVLLQFLSDLSESENLSFLLTNVVLKLNQVLLMKEGSDKDRVKCAIVTLYVSWTELRNSFTHLYLASGIIYFHQYYCNLTLQGVSKVPVQGVQCKWDLVENSFKVENTKPTAVSEDFNLWRIHVVYHLLELLRSVLRISPENANQLLRKQCIGLMSMSYLLVTSLYDYIENDNKTKALVTSVISTTEEVSYCLIRRLPGLFYVVADNIYNNESLIKIYIDMTGFLPSLISLYTHVTTFYLFISKDKKKRLSEKILGDYLEAFMHSILKVLGNICTIIDEIETTEKHKPTDIDKAITEYLEKIIMIKSVYFIILSILHCFEINQNSVNKIPTLTYIRIYERLKKITKFAETNFMNKSVSDHSYNFPEGFENGEIRKIPGSRNYIAVDFEQENEDDLFRIYVTSVLSWLWHLSLTDALCLEVIVDPATREIFRICFTYERWNIQSYMVLCGVLYNFTFHHTHSVLNCLPVTISMIVKLISELKIPIEGYILLFQSIRSIYPKIISPSIIQKIQQIIAPLRTLLSSNLPLLKYYNYPLLKPIGGSSKKKLAIGEERQNTLLEDENDSQSYFPRQLLKVLPFDRGEKDEAYPGQIVLQNESRSLIQMITPVTLEGIKKTKNKIMMHVKAGEADRLYSHASNSSLEERRSILLAGAGARAISSHYSIIEGDFLKNKRSVAKVEEGFNKLMLDIFDKEHGLKN